MLIPSNVRDWKKYQSNYINDSLPHKVRLRIGDTREEGEYSQIRLNLRALTNNTMQGGMKYNRENISKSLPADNQTKFQNTAEEHYSNKLFSVSTGVSFSMNDQAIDDSQQQVFIHRYDF